MRAVNTLVDFATKHPRLYLAYCFAGGLLIRWFWLGQDIHRFMDPLAFFR